MIRDIAADLRALLPSSVGVRVAHGAIFVRHDRRVLRMTAGAADALIRRLPTIAGPASIAVIEEDMPHPRGRLKSALRWLRVPADASRLARPG